MKLRRRSGEKEFAAAEANSDRYVTVATTHMEDELLNDAWRHGWALKFCFQQDGVQLNGNRFKGGFLMIFERQDAYV